MVVAVSSSITNLTDKTASNSENSIGQGSYTKQQSISGSNTAIRVNLVASQQQIVANGISENKVRFTSKIAIIDLFQAGHNILITFF